MQFRSQIALTLAFTLAVPNAIAADTQNKTWSNLSQEVRSEWTVRMVLPDSTSIEGKAARFTEDSLQLQVTKSSNPQAHPSGELKVPRAAVKTLEIRKNRVIGQILGTAVPLGAGAAIAGAGGSKGAFQGGGLMLAGILIGVAAIPLYFVGRSSDRRWERITVVP